MCVEALLVVWSDLSKRAREFDSRLSFVEKPLGNFDRDRFCFGFEGRTKFYALALYGALAPLLQAVPPVS